MLEIKILEKMNTKRLLAYKRKHYPYPSLAFEPYDEFDFKGKREYENNYKIIKEMLDKREHVGE